MSLALMHAAARPVGLILLAALVLGPMTHRPAVAQTAPAQSSPALSDALPPALPGSGMAMPTTAHPPMAPAASPAGQMTIEPAAPAVLPHDLSPWGMFKAADIVVKAVMIGLALASVATWTIWLAKALELAGAKASARRALTAIEKADGLDAAAASVAGRKGRLSGPVGRLLGSAVTETKRSVGLPEDGLKERVAIALSRIEAGSGRAMARGTGVLATIGSIAPFVGLFGTVWGIMNAFIGISQSKTTNLAVVAPGIAEALLATAIGLVAAIPAVIIYNVFSRAITGYRALLADASAEILRHLSRDLDRRRRVPVAGASHAPAQPQPAAMPRVPAE